MQRGLFWLVNQVGGWFRRPTRKLSGEESYRTAIEAQLTVRSLEPRYVLDAAPLAMPAVDSAPPPQETQLSQPPSGQVAWNATGNLLLSDLSGGNQAHFWTLNADATTGMLQVRDAAQADPSLQTDPAAPLVDTVSLPLGTVANTDVVISASGSADQVTLNFTGGVSSLSFDIQGSGTAGQTLTLTGNVDRAVYEFDSATSGRIILSDAHGTATITFHDIASITDGIVAQEREFRIPDGIHVALSDNNDASDQVSRLTLAGQSTIEFRDPSAALYLVEIPAASQTYDQWTLSGLDQEYRGDLQVVASASDTVLLVGAVGWNPHDLSVWAGVIDVDAHITSSGGLISLSAEQAIRVSATSTLTSPAGQILLDAGPTGRLEMLGTIDVSSTAEGTTGGTVHLLGREVLLDGIARVEASGAAGGGTILVGGDWQGTGTVPRATETYLGSDVILHASALVAGDGGKIVVWADQTARVLGSGNIQARGAGVGSRGGQIETSGKAYLQVGGAADASSPEGMPGVWLLDPYNVSIETGGGASLVGGVLNPVANNTKIAPLTITTALASGTSVVINTVGAGGQQGNIEVNDAIAAVPSVAGLSLTLNAVGSITVSGSITTTGTNGMDVIFNAGGDVLVSVAVTTNGGSFTSSGAKFTADGTISTSGGNVTLTHTNDVLFNTSLLAGSGAVSISTTGGSIDLDGATTSILAGSITLSASGNILSGGAAADLIVSGTGNISLTSGDAVGTVANPITLRLGTGLVSATAVNDVRLSSDRAMRVGTITTSGAGDTVSLTTTGAATSHLTIAGISSTNDDWVLTSVGDIAFSGTGSISEASAVLNAGGAITGGGATANIDTSAAGGNIAITAASGVGTSGSSLNVKAGAGNVSVNAGDDLFLDSLGILNLTAVTTSVGADVVRVRTLGATTNHLNLGNVYNTNDDWTIVSAGNITWTALASLTAASASLTAGGTISSGTAAIDINTSTAGGAIALAAGSGIGTSAAPLIVTAGAGTVSASTLGAAGNIFIDSPGVLNLGVVTTTATVDTVRIRTTGAATHHLNVLAASLTNDDWTLSSVGNIAFVGVGAFTANSAQLTSAAAITGGSAAAMVDTSAAGGAINLDAVSGIGTSVTPVSVSAGAGMVTAAVTGASADLFLTSPGPIKVGALSASGNGRTISVATTGGLLSTIALVAVNNTNDAWTLNSSGDIVFDLANTLTATTAVLTAGGVITSGTATTDLTTTAAGGISLTADGGIGVAGNPLSIIATGGSVSATTSAATGNIFLTSAASLALGAISTGAAVQTVSIATTGASTRDITISASSTTNDDWTLNAAGDVVFSGNVTITAKSAALTAGDDIVSGSGLVDLDTSAGGGGAISLTATGDLGTAASPLVVKADGGVVTASIGGDDLYLDSSGPLLLGTITTPAGADTVRIRTIGALTDHLSLTTAWASDDTVTLDSAGDIIFVAGASLAAASASLTAGGAITSGTAAVDVDTSAANGAILLSAGTGIGVAGNPFVVQAGNGIVTLTTTGAPGNIFLESPAALRLGAVTTAAGMQTVSVQTTGAVTNHLTLFATSTTDDAWTLTSAGDIAFSGSSHLIAASAALDATGTITSGGAAIDVDTQAANGNIVLRGFSLGASGSPLEIALGLGMLTLDALAGSIFVDIAAGNFATSQLALLSTGGGVATVALSTTAGSLTIDGGVFAASTADDDFRLTSGGMGNAIAFSGAGSLVAGSATLVSGGAITSGTAAIDISASNASGISLTAAGDIGASGNALAVSATAGSVSANTTGDSIYLESPTTLSLGSISTNPATAGTIDIRTLGAATNDLTLSASLTTNDNVALTAAGSVIFGGASAITAASVSLTAQGGGITSGTATTDISTAAANGNITLNAFGAIGAVGSPLTLAAGNGIVSATTTGPTGDVNLAAASPLNLGAISTAVGFQAVNIQTTGANSHLTLTTSSTTDDNWNLNSSGNIAFSGAANLVALSATLNATGNITSGSAAADITANTAGGFITLAGAALGTSGNPLELDVGLNPLSLTATSGGIFIDLPTGNLPISQIKTLSAAGNNVAIQLSAATGAILVDDTSGFAINTQDDRFFLTTVTAGQGISFIGATTLVASAATLNSAGAIVGGAASADIDTSAANGNIALNAADAIGSSANGVFVRAGATGVVTATTTNAGGDVYLVSPGLLNLGAVTTAASSAQIVRIRTTGAATNHLNVSATSNTNDAWTLISAGDIAFSGTAAITAANADLSAGGAIVGGTASADLDTSAANGAINLASVGSIGTNANSLAVKGGAGVVAATVTGAASDIFLTSPGPLQLGSVSTALGQSTVRVTTTGPANSLTLSAASNTDDSWTLNATGDIAFSGAGSLVAGSATLVSGGAITSGSAAIDITATNASGISLTAAGDIGASGNALAVSAIAGSVSANTTGNSIYLESPTTLSLGSISTNPATTGTIDIRAVGAVTNDLTLSGSLTTNDNVMLTAAGSVIFSGAATITAASVALTAQGGGISSGTATTDISTATANGNIILNALGGIGAAGNPLTLAAGNGIVSATTTGPTGDVNLAAASALNLGAISTAVGFQAVNIQTTGVNSHLTLTTTSTTDDNWNLISSGNIVFSGAANLVALSATLAATGNITSGSAATDITANTAGGFVSLSGAVLGTSGNPLELDVGLNPLSLTATSGGIFIDLPTGNLQTNQITTLSAAGNNVAIQLSAATGAILINGTGGFAANTQDDRFFLTTATAGQSISFIGPTTLIAAAATFNSAGAIVGGAASADIDTSAANGNIVLNAADAIGSSANGVFVRAGAAGIVTATTTNAGGDIYLVSPGLLNLGVVTTAAGSAQIVRIRTTGAATNHLNVSATSNTNDAWTLISAGDIAFSGTAAISAASANLNASGAIVGGTATADLDTSAANGAINLAAVGSIGTNANSLAVKGGAGVVAATVTGAASDIFLTSPGPLQLGTVSTALGQNTVRVTTTGPSNPLTLSAASNTDDSWTLNATGDIAFSGAGSLVAGSATLTSSGLITSGTSALDINTAAAGGNISLAAAGGIGTNLNSLLVTAGAGIVSASISGPAGDVFLDAPGVLNLGNISTSAATDVVRIRTLGPATNVLTVTAASTTNDDWSLDSAGDLNFIAAGPITAKNAQLSATGFLLTSGATPSVDTSALDGNIGLTAGTGIGFFLSPFSVKAGNGVVSATVTGALADIFLTAPGRLHLGTVATPAGIRNVQISTTGGATSDLFIDGVSNTDDAWLLNAGGDINFVGSGSIALASAALTSGGAIQSGTAGVDLNSAAVGGAISLSAVSAIGAALNPLVVAAGIGLVTPTTSSATGNIFLDSVSPLNLGTVTTTAGSGQTVAIRTMGATTNDLTLSASSLTNDRWTLQSAGRVVFGGNSTLTGGSVNVTAASNLESGTALIDIDTSAANGDITLAAVNLGQGANPIELSPGNGGLSLSAMGGDMFVDLATGNLSTSQITTLSSSGVGRQIALSTTSGNVTINDVSPFQADTADDALFFTARGLGSNVDFSGSVFIRHDNVTLSAAGNITGGTTRADLIAASPAAQFHLNAGGNIGTVLNPFAILGGTLSTNSLGDQHLQAVSAPLALANLSAGGSQLFLDAGIFQLGGTLTNTTLASNVVLSGTGIVNGNLTLLPDARLTPGTIADPTTIFTIGGNLLLGPGSKVTLDLGAPYLFPGGDFDQLRVGGSVFLANSILVLEGGLGAKSSATSITLLELINAGASVIGTFRISAGAVGTDGRIGVGNLTSGITYAGGLDGNDVVLNEITITPTIKTEGFRIVALRAPVLVAITPPNTPSTLIPPLATRTDPPVVIAATRGVTPRRIDVRVVTPLDDEGGTREQSVLDLEGEWIKNLSAVIRQLPDNRYRIYLILENGEERLVMEVLVRNRRPIDAGEERLSAPPADLQVPASPPDLPPPAQLPPTLLPPDESGAASEQPAVHTSAVVPVSTAAALGIAAILSSTRKSWAEDVDEALEARPPGAHLLARRQWQRLTQSK